MTVLGLDVAMKTGWALGTKTERPLSGVWKLPGMKDDTERAHTLFSLFSSVKCMVQAHGITGVAIEAPLLGMKRKNRRGVSTPVSAHGTMVLTQLNAVACAGAIAGGAKWIRTVYPNEWRRAVLGNGYPKNPKDAALRYCELMKWGVTEHDAAEACCIFQWGLGQEKLL